MASKDAGPSKSKMPFQPVARTLGEVAQFFGVSRDTVRKSWSTAGMPGKPGHYDCSEIYRWKTKRERDIAQEESDAAECKRLADARKANADAEMKERKNAVEAGDFAPISMIEEQILAIIPALRKNLMGVTNNLRPKLPREHEHRIAIELNAALETALAGTSKEILLAWNTVIRPQYSGSE